MFTEQDFNVFKQPESWEKIDQAGEIFFPKLAALKVKAESLISHIYGIEVNQLYKTYRSPAPSKARRTGQKFNPKRNDSNHVLSGFRAKGKPEFLKRATGKPCSMHFACTTIAVEYNEDGYETAQSKASQCLLLTDFSPYILRYEKRFYLSLLGSVFSHNLLNPVWDIWNEYSGINVENLPDEPEMVWSAFFTTHKAYLCMNVVDAVKASSQDIASVIVANAALFPLLDIFRRIGEGETFFDIEDDDSLIPLGTVNYVERFDAWRKTEHDSYIANFSVEALEEKTFFKSEAETRQLIEDITGMKFPKTRPSWLKMSNSRGNMELDGYCPELNLAFEYQGEQHYMDIFPNQEPWDKIQKRDKRKFEICRKNNVDLIQIPYWEKGNRQFILKQIESLGRRDLNL